MPTRFWSDDELIVLLAFYFRYPRLSQTNSHLDCQRLANVLGRTAGAVDHQLRNIDFDLVRKSADRHCSQRLASLLVRYKDNLPSVYKDANEVLDSNNWNFPHF